MTAAGFDDPREMAPHDAILAAALAYAARGFPVFPVHPGNKRPLTKHGFKDASTEPAIIRDWWGRWPEAMIGVPTGTVSGVVVLDVDCDPARGIDGEASLAALVATHGELSETPAAMTPRGGRHLYFRHPGGTVRNSTGRLGKGLDIKGDRGSIVVPPSVNRAGKPYVWVRVLGDVDMASPPAWLLAKTAPPERREPNGAGPARRRANGGDGQRDSYMAAVVRNAVADVARAPAGRRNHTLNCAAFGLGQFIPGGFLTTDLATHDLFEAATANGLVEDDGAEAVHKTIASGLGAGQLDPREPPRREAPPRRAGAARPSGRPGGTKDDGAAGSDAAEPSAPDAPRGAPADGSESTGAAVRRLAALKPLEYDRVREAEAGQLGVRLVTLDAEVAKERGDPARVATGQGQPLSLPEPEPWPEPVDGAALLDALAATFCRFLALPAGAPEALALWTVHTHAVNASEVTPRLAIISPVKRCGKTTCLELIGKLVPRQASAANITAAALFRTIEQARPTFLIDEADTFLAQSDELRGMLNSGHRRGGTVIRTVGDDHEPRQFSTWGPIAIACIKGLPDTLADRSIVVPMRRRRRDERIERWPPRDGTGLDRLTSQAARWAADAFGRLSEADPTLPDALHDRAADNWRPLLAIADAAGGEWPGRARRAALTLSGGGDGDDTSVTTMLLSDIRAIFAERMTDRLASAELSSVLAEMEDRPWPEWRAGKPITPRQLARLLAPFGVRPGTIETEAGPERKTPKGYKRDWFADAFARYLPPDPPFDPPHRHNPQEPSGSGDFRSATRPEDVADRNSRNPRQSATCGGVADRKGEAWEIEP